MIRAWDVDDGVEGDHGVEGPRREGDFDHVRLEEGGRRDVLSGEFQLPRRDVNAGDDEALVREPSGYRYAGAAAEVQHGGPRWQEGGQVFQGRERERIFGVLGGEVLFGHHDRIPTPQCDGGPRSTGRHAPVHDHARPYRRGRLVGGEVGGHRGDLLRRDEPAVRLAGLHVPARRFAGSS